MIRFSRIGQICQPGRRFELGFGHGSFFRSVRRLFKPIGAVRFGGQLGRLVGYLTLLSIFLACLGLLGLAAFTIEQRTKEIGIRKVLGASVPGIVSLLSQDFIRLVVVALVLAVPLAYLAASRWLEDFVYRIEIGIDLFLLTGGLVLLLALFTVSYQTLKAAR